MKAVPRKHTALCFSAYFNNLRAGAIIRCLQEAGIQVIQPRFNWSGGSITGMVMSIFPNLWFALTQRGDFAVGFKPHLNVCLPMMVCRIRGIPTWLDVDDLDHAYRENWLSGVIRMLQLPFPRFFQLVSYHHVKLRDFLLGEMRCGEKRLLRFPQGVDTRMFGLLPSKTDRARLEEKFHLQGRKVAVYAAHLNVAADLEPVLTAWKNVIRKMPQAMLLVVGGGQRTVEFHRKIQAWGLSDHVILTGEVPHLEIPVFFSLAQVALLYFSPRKVNQYRCSLKLREYFAFGIPVVCNNYGELADFSAFTCQTGSSGDEFTEEIVRVLNGGTDGRERNAREHAQKHLDWNHIYRTHEAEIFQRLGLQAGRAG